MDSWLRHSVLRTALRASVGAARLGVNLRPLPPEGMMNKDDRLAARQKIYAKLLCFDFLQRLTH